MSQARCSAAASSRTLVVVPGNGTALLDAGAESRWSSSLPGIPISVVGQIWIDESA